MNLFVIDTSRVIITIKITIKTSEYIDLLRYKQKNFLILLYKCENNSQNLISSPHKSFLLAS